ncbi:alpha/beta hydrolase [Myxococcota bacterium]|nr:alpha/beta hydrolase [Myxococcota bacterium]
MSQDKAALRIDRRLVDNGEGWQLELQRYHVEGALDRSRRPLLMIPGYAMNTFILGFHPTDRSMVEHLAHDGFEVWTANLRGQGGSVRGGRTARRYGMGELALVDLPRVLAAVRSDSASAHAIVDLVGCSLGASLVYAYLAHHPDDHGVGAVIAIGGPLRWVQVHPALALAFKSPRLAGMIPVVGTRALARRALPLVRHVPPLLSIYMNARRVDLSRPDLLVNTVDDPVPYINRQVARWVRDRDLVVRGLNVTEGMRRVDLPVLVVLANRDGIVPAATARSVADLLPEHRVTVLEVGEGDRWYAHADLFIGAEARREVFEPMAAWLRAQQPVA